MIGNRVIDINDFAFKLLIEFFDAANTELVSILKDEFGDQWLEEGVRRHLDKKSVARTEKMLNNPMRVVDMGKEEEDLYGVEHIWNIIAGNWKKLFGPIFQDWARTQEFLSEITELRNNLAISYYPI